MRIREAILHSEKRVNGAVTMAKIVTAGKGKRVIHLIQTRGDKASSVTLDEKEYRALVAFASGKKKRRQRRPACLGEEDGTKPQTSLRKRLSVAI